MHILQVGSYLPPDLVGGAETSANNLREILESAGHTMSSLRWKQASGFTVRLTLKKILARGWAGETWRTFEPIAPRAGIAKAGFYLMEFLTRTNANQIEAFLADTAVDLVLVHSYRGFGYDLVDKLCRTGVPIIFILHDFALVCMNKGMARKGTPCQALCTQCRYVSYRICRALARSSPFALVAPSRYVLDAVGDGLQVAPDLRHHIPNPNRYTTITRVRDHHSPLTLGYVGRLEADKGVAGLLGIADRLHTTTGLRWVIAGKGKLTNEVAAFAATRDWVDFRGEVPANEVHRVYDAIDVLAIPSLWPENFPGVAVHAMGSGVPCVGFDIGGIPEVIDHGETGFIVPFGDFAALGDRVIELHRDRALLAQMSRASPVACARYDPAMLARRWLDLVSGMA